MIQDVLFKRHISFIDVFCFFMLSVSDGRSDHVADSLYLLSR